MGQVITFKLDHLEQKADTNIKFMLEGHDILAWRLHDLRRANVKTKSSTTLS